MIARQKLGNDLCGWNVTINVPAFIILSLSFGATLRQEKSNFDSLKIIFDLPYEFRLSKWYQQGDHVAFSEYTRSRYLHTIPK